MAVATYSSQYPGICLEGQSKTTNIKDIQSPRQADTWEGWLTWYTEKHAYTDLVTDSGQSQWTTVEGRLLTIPISWVLESRRPEIELGEFAESSVLVNGFDGITDGYCCSLRRRMAQKFVSRRLLSGYWQIVIYLFERAGLLEVRQKVQCLESIHDDTANPLQSILNIKLPLVLLRHHGTR
jgi:hypothetical protein